jgi:hypothetical protein
VFREFVGGIYEVQISGPKKKIVDNGLIEDQTIELRRLL